MSIAFMTQRENLVGGGEVIYEILRLPVADGQRYNYPIPPSSSSLAADKQIDRSAGQG